MPHFPHMILFFEEIYLPFLKTSTLHFRTGMRKWNRGAQMTLPYTMLNATEYIITQPEKNLMLLNGYEFHDS